MSRVALHHRRYGEGGPPLLILHGLFGSARNWHSQANLLAADFAVITADLRNHGASPHTERIDYEEMAGDVLALMDTLELARAHLLGHSMGGKVAMQIALNEPHRIERLVVVDIAPKAYPPHHDDILAALRALDPAAHRDRQSVDAALREGIPDPGIRQFILTNLVREANGLAWQLNLEGIVRDYARLSEPPRGGQPFVAPALFVKGGNSDYITSADRAEITRLFPGARAKVIDNAGHWPHAEKPQVFAKIVRDFLREDETA